jgi:threonine dehydratase
MIETPIFKDIEIASRLISPYIHHTPVMTSKSINRILGTEIFFKCENLQMTGAFKFRGACNAIFSLSDKEAAKGVGTHSSGNHAAALAHAASQRGIKAYIVMPYTAPEIKKKAVLGYGGEITFCEPTLQSRESKMQDLIDKIGITLVHSYNNFKVISGQGTSALELINEVEGLDLVMCPVGGGGLLSGTALSVKTLNPRCKVIAAEPSGADDAFRSFHAGHIFPSVNPMTIADGLLTSLGEITFSIIRKNVDDIVTVSEQSIVDAMRLIWERMKIIIEPSSAVPLAALLEKKIDLKIHRKIGIILSGGNVDLSKLPF